MTEPNREGESTERVPHVGIDTWAVALALILAALVRLGWFPKVNW